MQLIRRGRAARFQAAPGKPPNAFPKSLNGTFSPPMAPGTVAGRRRSPVSQTQLRQASFLPVPTRELTRPRPAASPPVCVLGSLSRTTRATRPSPVSEWQGRQKGSPHPPGASQSTSLALVLISGSMPKRTQGLQSDPASRRRSEAAPLPAAALPRPRPARRPKGLRRSKAAPLPAAAPPRPRPPLAPTRCVGIPST